jgi:hypothetical protein
MDLQDMRTASIVNACKACGYVAIVRVQCSANTMDHSPGTTTVQSDSTAQRHTADRVQRGRR